MKIDTISEISEKDIKNLVDSAILARGKEYYREGRVRTIEISKDNLLHNYKVLSSINKKVKVAPVLKSNAYGHGIKEIAKSLQIGVGSVYQALRADQTAA